MHISEETKTEIKPNDEEIVYSEYVNVSKKPGLRATSLKQLSEHSSERSNSIQKRESLANTVNLHQKKVKGVQMIMSSQVQVPRILNDNYPVKI